MINLKNLPFSILNEVGKELFISKEFIREVFNLRLILIKIMKMRIIDIIQAQNVLMIDMIKPNYLLDSHLYFLQLIKQRSKIYDSRRFPHEYVFSCNRLASKKRD